MVAQIEGSHLNDGTVSLVLTTFVIIIIIVILLTEMFFVKSSDNEIKYGNDISGIVFQLPIKTLIELIHVIAVDIEYVLFSLAYILQLLHVEGKSSEIIWVLIDLHICSQEIPQFLGDFIGIDISSVENLSAGGGFYMIAHTH